MSFGKMPRGGGALELQLLAAHWGTTFVVLNIQTGKQLHFTAEGLPSATGDVPVPAHDGNMSFLLYDGLHYDAVGGAPAGQGGASTDSLQRVFTTGDASARAAADVLVQAEHSKRAFTDVTSYTLRCLVCQKGLTGNDQAVKHAQATGHTNFSEYS